MAKKEINAKREKIIAEALEKGLHSRKGRMALAEAMIQPILSRARLPSFRPTISWPCPECKTYVEFKKDCPECGAWWFDERTILVRPGDVGVGKDETYDQERL